MEPQGQNMRDLGHKIWDNDQHQQQIQVRQMPEKEDLKLRMTKKKKKVVPKMLEEVPKGVEEVLSVRVITPEKSSGVYPRDTDLCSITAHSSDKRENIMRRFGVLIEHFIGHCLLGLHYIRKDISPLILHCILDMYHQKFIDNRLDPHRNTPFLATDQFEMAYHLSATVIQPFLCQRALYRILEEELSRNFSVTLKMMLHFIADPMAIAFSSGDECLVEYDEGRRLSLMESPQVTDKNLRLKFVMLAGSNERNYLLISHILRNRSLDETLIKRLMEPLLCHGESCFRNISYYDAILRYERTLTEGSLFFAWRPIVYKYLLHFLFNRPHYYMAKNVCGNGDLVFVRSVNDDDEAEGKSSFRRGKTCCSLPFRCQFIIKYEVKTYDFIPVQMIHTDISILESTCLSGQCTCNAEYRFIRLHNPIDPMTGRPMVTDTSPGEDREPNEKKRLSLKYQRIIEWNKHFMDQTDKMFQALKNLADFYSTLTYDRHAFTQCDYSYETNICIPGGDGRIRQ